MKQTILFSNIGYAKGIDGSLWQHVCHLNRHIYSSVAVQQAVLGQLQTIIQEKDPDVCCFVEVDQKSWHAAGFDQMAYLSGETYSFHDSADKYGPTSWLSRMPLHYGKSNGFMAKQSISYERFYLNIGTKRLFYKLTLPGDVDLIFGHFSLQHKVRLRQFEEIADRVRHQTNPAIVLGDFNILRGFTEIETLLASTGLQLLNRPDEYTFMFHRRQLALDLCLCSKELLPYIDLQIVPQDFSDHEALLVTLHHPQ